MLFRTRDQLDIPKLRGRKRNIQSMQVDVSEQVDHTHLVYHIALRMPMFIYVIPIDLNELLQDGRLAASAFDGESSGVMKVAIDLSSVFII